jgi:hypothetical protein
MDTPPQMHAIAFDKREHFPNGVSLLVITDATRELILFAEGSLAWAGWQIQTGFSRLRQRNQGNHSLSDRAQHCLASGRQAVPLHVSVKW